MIRRGPFCRAQCVKKRPLHFQAVYDFCAKNRSDISIRSTLTNERCTLLAFFSSCSEIALLLSVWTKHRSTCLYLLLVMLESLMHCASPCGGWSRSFQVGPIIDGSYQKLSLELFAFLLNKWFLPCLVGEFRSPPISNTVRPITNVNISSLWIRHCLAQGVYLYQATLEILFCSYMYACKHITAHLTIHLITAMIHCSTSSSRHHWRHRGRRKERCTSLRENMQSRFEMAFAELQWV